MSTPLYIRQMQIFRLAVPLRFRFEHAAAARDTADPIIVRLSAGSPYAHHAGYGETLARPYVTGETAETVVEDLAKFFGPCLEDFKPTTFAEALEFIEALPFDDSGRVVNAARAAIELALLDLCGRAFHRRLSDLAGWMGLAGFGQPGCLAEARYSGIVVGRTPGKLKTLLRLQRCYGLRDFKIKVAVAGWEEQLERAYHLLKRPLERQRATLRADANGGWTLEQARAALPLLERCGVSALEQPLPDSEDAHLPQLARETNCHLIVDESLLTMEDAQRLIAGGGVRVLNIRLAKNGGLMPALRIARLALSNDLDVQLGCLVGETSILTAAGLGFLEACPKTRFVEGAFGRFLLKKDVVRRPIRFGRRGHVAARAGFGLGIDADETALRRLCVEPPQALNF